MDPSLSQQALVDCSWGFGNNGCDGGEDWRVYQFMMKHGGIPTEDSYGPYLGQDGYCHFNQSNIGLKIKGWVNVTSGDLDALKEGECRLQCLETHLHLAGRYHRPRPCLRCYRRRSQESQLLL